MPAPSNPSIILASNSPRRRQLLALTGLEFSVQPADIDETHFAGEAPAAYVLRLAVGKAQAILDQLPPGHGETVILASDTTVVADGEVLGKPEDPAEAVCMLQKLRGKTHQVFTGLALIRASDGNRLTDLCVSDVPMRAYTEAEIEAYVATGDPLDKAGAYGIQHAGFHPVERVHGCYPSVMGLPLCRAVSLLKKFGVTPMRDVTQKCLADPDAACEIYDLILTNVPVTGKD
jgi:septum formation protein